MSASAPIRSPAEAIPRRQVGVAAAGLGVAAQWLVHLGRPAVPFPPFSVGDWVIRRAPGGLATAAIEHLGHDAKRALAGACTLGALALGAALGRRPPMVLASVAVVLSATAAWIDPTRPAPSAIVPAALVGGAVVVAVAAALRSAPPTPRHADTGRRRVLAALGLLVGMAALGTGALRRSLRPVSAALVRADRPAPRVDDPGFSGVPGLSRAVTSRADHYTVEIDLTEPRIDAGRWRLRLGGAVEAERAFSLDELRAMPTVERVMAMACISNPVGGPLVGNAAWTGVPLAELLRLVRPRPEAVGLEARGADGYHDTLPLAAARDPNVLVAFAMNGLLLPTAHGFPARLRVPDRYGVKNVKWLTELVVLDHDAPGYWAERGWDPVARVHMSSRIDVPANTSTVAPTFTVAGVAWAGARGIGAVELSTDDGGSWLPARLEARGDPLAWRRWRRTVRLAPGVHPISVRATDGTGALQEPDRRRAHPAGATGYHRVVVEVR